MTRTPGNTSWGGNRRSFPTGVRLAILNRDGYRCQIAGPTCTLTATEADHIIPWSRGGTDDPANGQAVCTSCHALKTQHERQLGQQRHSKKRQPPSHPGFR